MINNDNIAIINRFHAPINSNSIKTNVQSRRVRAILRCPSEKLGIALCSVRCFEFVSLSVCQFVSLSVCQFVSLLVCAES